ncbi:MAG: response regulator [Nitrospira sp. BO4]|jgi:two-component system response regulator (stage 0 sporulation protein F)|nr:response regulator [Nitrospira sp. BO4]
MATILVIDDEAPIRTLLSTALQSAGHEAVEASNGREGVDLYRQSPVDLVIVDILMPELNGLDTIMELTREFLNVKVIAVSGVVDDQSMLSTARLLGARQTLRKPFGIDELLWAVRYELAH